MAKYNLLFPLDVTEIKVVSSECVESTRYRTG